MLARLDAIPENAQQLEFARLSDTAVWVVRPSNAQRVPFVVFPPKLRVVEVPTPTMVEVPIPIMVEVPTPTMVEVPIPIMVEVPTPIMAVAAAVTPIMVLVRVAIKVISTD